MKKTKKLFALICMTTILSTSQVFATDINDFGEVKYSESYMEYLELENKDDVIMPSMYEISQSKMPITNPLKLTRLLANTSNSSFSLKELIPANMKIKSQQRTNSCWTFASLSGLESNLALKDYKNGVTTPIVYDFSERHMEYATSKTFKNNQINTNGFNRQVGEGGSYLISMAYLTNGTGAIAEAQMPFENNENKINISEIQGKDVITQVNDLRIFPSYSASADKTEIIKEMKDHIKNYGAIDACIHGSSIDMNSKVYNNKTGAIYCNNSVNYPINHGVSIIGWDDNYSVDNFVATNKPRNNGAWIIRNSWGTEIIRYTLDEMKQILYDKYPNKWSSINEITNEEAVDSFSQSGYKIDSNNEAYLPIGDEGFMYVSYEDANIYTQLVGIEDAQSEISYENIYQYDNYGPSVTISMYASKVYVATEFDKKSSGKEYLTQVALTASEPYTCKVYVNPNGTSKAMKDLTEVELKSGESEIVDPGYHTIEFLEPLKINSDKFVVVLEIQGKQPNFMTMMAEANIKEFSGTSTIFDNITIENGKCFIITDGEIADNLWQDTSKLYNSSGRRIPNFDTTIKAFTTSNVLETIQVTTPPTKTNYVVGQDFNKAGMVVKSNYANGKSYEITDYSILNDKDLALGQTEVTIVYQNKTTTQPIVVEANTVESLVIKNAPTKTEYWAGDDFETSGMVIEAIYKDESRRIVGETEYKIEDGKTLKNGQTSVTISFEGKSIEQQITVLVNSVEKLEITQEPNKVNYVAGQDFDATGMIIKAIYKNGNEKVVTDYKVQDGTDLKVTQTKVTISYEEQTVEQPITVVEKAITGIAIKSLPTKTQYIQNKEELDLLGGVIEVSYNDGAKEEVQMTSKEITASGFDNKVVGTQTITLTYEGKKLQFSVEVIELPKPQNSKFDEIQGNVTRIRAYLFTDKAKQEHAILNIQLDKIVKATENDEIEYYYHLSANPHEENISNWVEIKDIKEENGKMSFEINTLDITNYDELATENSIYLYVKEVAVRNDMKSEVVSTSLPLEIENLKVEEYLDGEKKAETSAGTTTDSTPAEKEDDTKAPGSIPKAGHDLLMICLAIAIITIGKISYSKYKDMP